jgi:hypothetical protein
MKLYKLDRQASFNLDEYPLTPPDSLAVERDEIYRLVKLDGMYGWCKDGNNNDHFFSASTEVTPVEVEQND